MTRAIVEEPPLTVREGGIIREGYNAEADQLRHAKTEGKTWLADLEAKERDKTGIKNLKVKFNKVFGYYIEVSNAYKGQVPADYVRKQTVANAERYITAELKDLEHKILTAKDRLTALEYQLFQALREAAEPAALEGLQEIPITVDSAMAQQVPVPFPAKEQETELCSNEKSRRELGLSYMTLAEGMGRTYRAFRSVFAP